MVEPTTSYASQLWDTASDYAEKGYDFIKDTFSSDDEDKEEDESKYSKMSDKELERKDNELTAEGKELKNKAGKMGAIMGMASKGGSSVDDSNIMKPSSVASIGLSGYNPDKYKV